MSDDLPEGWITARLADVVQQVPNVKPEDEPKREFGYVDISSICNSTHRVTDAKRFKGSEAPSRARRPIRAGDVLFSNVRTYLRNIAIVPEGLDVHLCSTGFTVLRSNGGVDPHFLFRYVLTDDFIDRVTPQQTGTHYPATSDRVVMNEWVPLPPLLERIRMEREKRAPKRSKIASEGIEPLFEIPETWGWTTWHDVVDWVTYGFTRPMPHVAKGIPIITAKNISGSKIDFNEVDYTTAEAYAELSDKDRPQPGEILLTKDGSIGRAAIVNVSTPFCINQSVAVLRFGGLTGHVPYLLRAIEAPFTQELIEDGAKGSAIRHISITAFARFPLPFPPLAEQKEIVGRINALFALADAIERRVAAATARVGKLTQAVLAKAFRGELVPTESELARREGRDYEPASALLERIRAERAPGNGRTSRKARLTAGKRKRGDTGPTLFRDSK